MTRGARPRFFCALWATLLVITALAAGSATAAATPAGRWAGEIDTPDGKKAEIYLVLDQKDGAWTGSLEDPLQGSAAVTGLKVTATSISFKFQPQGSPFPVSFNGNYVAADDRVSGTFALQGTTRDVKFKRVGAPTGTTPAAVAGATGAATAAPDTSKAAVRTKHPYRLAISGRMAWWASLKSVKDEEYTINNLTASAPAFDGAVKWFVLDGFSVFVRGIRAGQNMTEDPERLAAFAANGLTSESYLSLDGFEVGVTGYLGAKLMPRSHFNPYLTGGAGRYQWTMTTAGRGTEPMAIELQALEGTDMGGWFGMGTEYALGEKLALDFEWAWRFFLTRDTKTWRDSEDTWGNTLAWAMSAGVTYGF